VGGLAEVGLQGAKLAGGYKFEFLQLLDGGGVDWSVDA
jgi:hypothetical protein